MPIVTFSWNITRIALECTLEYYEILNSRFALEHRYTADGRFIDSESRASRLLENCDIHHIIDLHERLGKTARERLTVCGVRVLVFENLITHCITHVFENI